MRPAAKMPKLTRRSRILITVALVVVLLLLIGPRLVDTYVDWLWFGELGYRSVFTTELVTRLVIFLVVACSSVRSSSPVWRWRIARGRCSCRPTGPTIRWPATAQR